MDDLIELIVALIALFTAYTAAKGVRAWSEQLAGQTQYQIAREYLESVFVLRDCFWEVRIPLVRSTEFSKEDPYPDSATSDFERARAFAGMFKRRSEPLLEAMKNFRGTSVKAEVLWGNDAKRDIDAIRAAVNSWFVAVETYIDGIRDGGATFASDRDFAIRIRREVFNSRSSWKRGSDELSDLMMDGIDGAENLCRRVMNLGR